MTECSFLKDLFMTVEDIFAYPYDPWLILGIPEDAGDSDVERAWKSAGSPSAGIVAQAREMLKTGHSRRRYLLLSPRAFVTADDALSSLMKHPVFLGPGAWYDAIEQRKPS